MRKIQAVSPGQAPVFPNEGPFGGLACLTYPSPGKCEFKVEYEQHLELWPINS